MGDEDDGALLAGLQLEQLILHFGADQGIQRGESFVHQQDVGVIGKGPGQPDPLLHAAGEGIRISLYPLSEPHLMERLTGALLALRQRYTGQLQPEGGIFQHTQVRHQGEGLEYHADLLAAHPAQFALRDGGDVLAIDQHLAAGRLDQPVEETHQSGLARTGEAHHHEDLPFVDGQIDILDPQGLSGLFQDTGAIMPFRQQFERFIRLIAEDFVEGFDLEFDCHIVLFSWPTPCLANRRT